MLSLFRILSRQSTYSIVSTGKFERISGKANFLDKIPKKLYFANKSKPMTNLCFTIRASKLRNVQFSAEKVDYDFFVILAILD